MNPFDMSEESNEAGDFGAFADAVADGRSPEPGDEIEDTFLRVQAALGPLAMAASTMPAGDREMLENELMNPIAPSTLTSLPLSPAFSVDQKREERGFVSRNMDRWQAAVSMAAVIALLVGMSAFLYQNQFRDDPPTPTSTPAGFGQTIYDGTDSESWTMVPQYCVANGPVESDDYYAEQSIDQWPLPQYTEPRAVSLDIGQKIQQTYLNYQRCYQDVVDGLMASYTPVAEGTPAPIQPRSLLLDSYFSDRARYVMLGDGIGNDDLLDAEGLADIENFLCELPRENVILTSFPLPLNQPNDFAALDMLPDGEPNTVVSSFLPSDVYRMADGRFGVVLGSISTTELRDPSLIVSNDLMTFVAFVEKDGRYYIDEEFLIWWPESAEKYVVDPCEAVRND